MNKRVITSLGIALSTMALLTSCDNSANTASSPTSETAVSPVEQTTSDTIHSTDSNAPNNRKAIDWQRLATGVTAANRAEYEYPFAIDSQNVQDYADYFKVDNATAQYNLTVSMASNEALSKLLDQLSNTYTSHELIDGQDIKLIVHTTSAVQADRYDYVFGEDFAKGLVLPIVIQPDGVKGDAVDPHGEVAE